MSHLFIFGLGYTAIRIADLLKQKSWRVFGTTRSAEKIPRLQRHGIEAVLYPSPQSFEQIQGLAWATHLLSTIPPDAENDPLLAQHAEAMAKLCPKLKWLGYISSSAVYGDRDGAWVDENTPCYLASAAGEARIRAEKQWLALPQPAHIFRMAGLYGPGRNVLTELRAGTAQRVDKPGHVFNRIHVDDMVQTVLASIKQPFPGKIYNVTDDEPASRADVVAYGAELLGMAPPPLVPYAQAQLSPQMRVFYEECKRVKNDRIKQELGVKLQYPTYREGLRQLLADEKAKP